VAPSPDTAPARELQAVSTGEPGGPADAPGSSAFRLTVGDFDGPFDLLVQLVAKRELDITELALSAVTAEFLSYVREIEQAAGADVDRLDEVSQFIVVAATLLDLKVAELLPRGELVDPEDVALLEARDLLFARLLQYRAFKEAAAWFSGRLDGEATRHARTVKLEERFRRQTPELRWTLGVDDFAALALLALTPREIPLVALDHLHAPLVSIREQAAHVVAMLRGGEPMSFRQLVAGIVQRGVVVARFIAILELYRGAAVSFEQIEPLGELTIRWTAPRWSDDMLANLGADYD